MNENVDFIEKIKTQIEILKQEIKDKEDILKNLIEQNLEIDDEFNEE